MSKLDCGGNWIACPSYIGNSAGGAAPPVFICNYITEDALLAYSAEDASTFYIPEDCPSGPFGPSFIMIPSVFNQGGGQWRMI